MRLKFIKLFILLSFISLSSFGQSSIKVKAIENKQSQENDNLKVHEYLDMERNDRDVYLAAMINSLAENFEERSKLSGANPMFAEYANFLRDSYLLTGNNTSDQRVEAITDFLITIDQVSKTNGKMHVIDVFKSHSLKKFKLVKQ